MKASRLNLLYSISMKNYKALGISICKRNWYFNEWECGRYLWTKLRHTIDSQSNSLFRLLKALVSRKNLKHFRITHLKLDLLQNPTRKKNCNIYLNFVIQKYGGILYKVKCHSLNSSVVYCRTIEYRGALLNE